MPVALIIGARNFGYAIIERLLADDWSVVGAAQSASTLERVRAAGAGALEVDVTDQESVLAALRDVAARHGRVDLAVNAASPYGGDRSGPFGGGPLAQAAASVWRTGPSARCAGRSRSSARRPASSASRAATPRSSRSRAARRAGRCRAVACGPPAPSACGR